MRVEGRDLVDFGQRHLHLKRQRGEMRGGDVVVVVLNEMQMLDQEIAAARLVGKQSLDFGKRLRINLAALWRAWRFAPACALAVRLRRRRLHVHGWLPGSSLEPFHFPYNPKIEIG